MNRKIYESRLVRKFFAIIITGIVFGIIIECIICQGDRFLFLTGNTIEIINKTKIDYDRLLYTVLEKRLSVFILIMLMGMTSGGKSIFKIFLFWSSSCLGMFLVESAKYRLLKCIMIFLGFFMPQYLFYVPAFYFVYFQIDKFSGKRNNCNKPVNKVFINNIVQYLLGFFIVLLLVLLGIFAETYINPIFVKKIVKKM